jgi:hypothetical protein
LHPAFEQGNNLPGGQMHVQLARDCEKPVVNAFACVRWRGEHFINE